jgi:catechol 2,3-dioxygenase-like lactoylglutathione lyase family enzyme
MTVSKLKVGPTIAVSDMDAAKEFYEGKLGLSGGVEKGDGGTTYQCSEGTEVHVYPSPGNAGKSGATLAGWWTDDVEGVVDELSSKGVTFEQYDMEELKTNEKGIADFGDVQAAWFKDPDGNILSIGND